MLQRQWGAHSLETSNWAFHISIINLSEFVWPVKIDLLNYLGYLVMWWHDPLIQTNLNTEETVTLIQTAWLRQKLDVNHRRIAAGFCVSVPPDTFMTHISFIFLHLIIATAAPFTFCLSFFHLSRFTGLSRLYLSLNLCQHVIPKGVDIQIMPPPCAQSQSQSFVRIAQNVLL